MSLPCSFPPGAITDVRSISLLNLGRLRVVGGDRLAQVIDDLDERLLIRQVVNDLGVRLIVRDRRGRVAPSSLGFDVVLYLLDLGCECVAAGRLNRQPTPLLIHGCVYPLVVRGHAPAWLGWRKWRPPRDLRESRPKLGRCAEVRINRPVAGR